MSFNFLVNEAEEKRIAEAMRTFEMSEGEMEKGLYKAVWPGLRGVFKLGFVEEVASSGHTDNIDQYPWAVAETVDLSDRGFDSDSTLIEMRQSDLDHGEAVNLMGVSEVIERDIDHFMDYLSEGMVYADFKPANIHYFRNGRDYEPMAVDIFDEEVNERWNEEVDQISENLGLYIKGNSEYEGIADRYDIPISRAEEEVMSALGIEEPERYIRGYTVINLEDAVREGTDILE